MGKEMGEGEGEEGEEVGKEMGVDEGERRDGRW